MYIELVQKVYVGRLGGQNQPSPNGRAVIPTGTDVPEARLGNAADVIDRQVHDRLRNGRSHAEKRLGGRSICPQAVPGEKE